MNSVEKYINNYIRIFNMQILSFILILLHSFIISSMAMNSNNVIISWNKNSESDLSGYKIFRGEESGTYYDSVDIGNNTQFHWNNLTPNVTYYFAVTAYDKSGNESPFSDEVILFIDDDNGQIDTLDTSLNATISNAYNFPNPFINKSTLYFYLNTNQIISIDIYDDYQNLIIQLRKNMSFRRGGHLIEWDGKNKHGVPVNRGIYYCIISNKRVRAIIKLLAN